jgi:hypothetical protein
MLPSAFSASFVIQRENDIFSMFPFQYLLRVVQIASEKRDSETEIILGIPPNHSLKGLQFVPQRCIEAISSN